MHVSADYTSRIVYAVGSASSPLQSLLVMTDCCFTNQQV